MRRGRARAPPRRCASRATSGGRSCPSRSKRSLQKAEAIGPWILFRPGTPSAERIFSGCCRLAARRETRRPTFILAQRNDEVGADPGFAAVEALIGNGDRTAAGEQLVNPRQRLRGDGQA